MATHLIKGSSRCWIKEFIISLRACASTVDWLFLSILPCSSLNPLCWSRREHWAISQSISHLLAAEPSINTVSMCVSVGYSMGPSRCLFLTLWAIVHKKASLWCLPPQEEFDSGLNHRPQSRITPWEGTCGPFELGFISAPSLQGTRQVSSCFYSKQREGQSFSRQIKCSSIIKIHHNLLFSCFDLLY